MFPRNQIRQLRSICIDQPGHIIDICGRRRDTERPAGRFNGAATGQLDLRFAEYVDDVFWLESLPRMIDISYCY